MRLSAGLFATCLLILPIFAVSEVRAGDATVRYHPGMPTTRDFNVSEWSTSEGAMTLREIGSTIEGTYDQDGGRLSVIPDDHFRDTWAGLWAETASNHYCNEAQLGSHYWGHITMTFSNEQRHFDAKWSYCGSPSASGAIWTGDRVR